MPLTPTVVGKYEAIAFHQVANEMGSCDALSPALTVLGVFARAGKSVSGAGALNVG